MRNSFKDILIPVDFSANTDVAIEKGLELSEAGTTIHLLHVQRYILPGVIPAIHWANPVALPDYKMIAQRLALWKNMIEDRGRDIHARIWLLPANTIQRVIEETATDIGADLVIIGKKKDHSWLTFLNTVNPRKIAAKTGIAVLTVKPESINTRNRTIVIPVSKEAAHYKKDIVAAICNKFQLRIHLVTFRSNEREPSSLDASLLLQVYQWFKTSTNCQVEHEILPGQNKAEAVLNYANRVDANILLLHPEEKPGKTDKQLTRVLPSSSKLQVLAV